MYLTNEQMILLMERLAMLTVRDHYVWPETGSGSDAYTLRKQDFEYVVRSRDADGVAPYIFEVWRQRKDRAEFALVGQVESRPAGAELNAALLRLYNAASGSTVSVDSLWDDILGNLDD